MKKSLLGILIMLGILAGCSSDDDKLKSSENEIKSFTLEEQVGNAKITDTEINLSVSAKDITSLAATEIVVSDYATVSPEVGEKQNFSSPVNYTVTAEDGSTRVYKVTVTSTAQDDDKDKDKDNDKDNDNDNDDPIITGQQIPNSSFDIWHEVTSGKLVYPQIGEDEKDLTWGTGNAGAVVIKSMNKDVEYPTTPYTEEEGRKAVKLETQNMGKLAAGTLGGGKGVAAGSIFLGTFDKAKLTNAHPVLGLPFTDTPSSFKIDYKYFPNDKMFNGKLEEVEGSDALDIYVILERREGDNVKRLGVGWFRSGDKQEDWKTKEVEIVYAQGAKPAGLEDYQTKISKYGIDGDITITDPAQMGEATWGDITKEKPTHIVAVFTSSYQGDYFIGAPGSTLYVDNFELVYK